MNGAFHLPHIAVPDCLLTALRSMELFLFAAYWFRPASLNFSQRVYAAVDPPVVCCMPATL